MTEESNDMISVACWLVVIPVVIWLLFPYEWIGEKLRARKTKKRDEKDGYRRV